MNKNIDRSVAFFNGNHFYIATQSTGMLAYPEPSAEPHYFSYDVDDLVLGRALRIALGNSRVTEMEEFQRIWKSGEIQKLESERSAWAMKEYGYKTRRAMYRFMNCCSIERKDGTIDIYPMHHKSLDTYRGISHDGPEILHLPEVASDAELGAALREGFRRCTSAIK
jgi:hypothetical protein